MRKFLLLPLLLLIVAGCDEQEPPPTDVVRAVKTVVVEARAGLQARRIAGIVESDVVSDLSFEVGGKIIALEVDFGDAVEAEEEIARLDEEPYRLRVQTAMSELTEANARLQETRERFTQQSTLYEQGFATKTAYDSALADYEAAQSTVAVAETQLDLAERDLRNTILRAPFAGLVAERYVDLFAEVSAGQHIVQLHDETTLNVEVSVPESLISFIQRLDPVTLVFPTLGDLEIVGEVSEIGARTTSANAFPVSVALGEQPERVRPGMTAEVIFEFENTATGEGFVLPNTALLISGQEDVAYVFVFNPETSRVERHEVQVISIRDNEIAVTGDIAEGDIVVVAGVSFLADNMQVRLMDESN